MFFKILYVIGFFGMILGVLISFESLVSLFSLTALKVDLIEFFTLALPQASLGETLILFFQSVYFLRSLDLGFYGLIGLNVLLWVVLAFFVYLIYITVQTLRMKKEMLMMSSVIGKEGEVIEVTDDYGKEGWILIYGENWRFKSKNILKVGDLVKVTKNKKMKLIVEKIEEVF